MPVRSRLLYLAIAVALVIGGCTRGGGQSSNSGGQTSSTGGESYGSTGSYGILTGGITRRPMSGESRPAAPSSASPVAGAELKIFDFKGALVATARTNGSGLYRATLPPGNYRVGRGAGFLGGARNLPAIVAISPGGQTRLDIWVDSEVRAPGGSAATR
jgi:hypothetical protein